MSKFCARVVAVLRGLVIVGGLLALDAARADAPAVDVDRSDEWVTGAVDLLAADPQDLGTAVKAAAATVSLKLTASTMIVAAPAAVTLTATISGGTLKGNVIFKAGSVVVGNAAITKSSAVLTTSLPVGIHSLTAVFAATGGDIVSAAESVIVDNAATCG